MKKFLLFLLSFGVVFAFDASIFPPASSGEKQYIINLPAKKDESKFQVVIEFGRVVSVDCNTHFFTGGSLERLNLDGYGYVYYKFSDEDSNLISTKMACPDYKNQDEFVKFSHKISTFYSSQTPLVIYTPSSVKLRYKIYKLVDEKMVE